MEANGKLILIGVYSGHMFIHGEFPVTLPKLCFRIVYLERPGESDEPIDIVISVPGDNPNDPALKSTIPREGIKSLESFDPPPGDGEVFISATLQLEMSILIKQEGAIRVRAFRGDTEAKLGSLLIHKAPPIVPLNGVNPSAPNV
jgi:hypothetical protein